MTITSEMLCLAKPSMAMRLSVTSIASKASSRSICYATPNTRRPRPVNPLDCAWLHRMRRPRWNRRWHGWRASAGYRLLILDALRPQRVQEQLWQTLQGTDLLGYIAEPVRGSIHSFGMALDLTIVDQAGAGAGYGHGFR
jgi:D-alanyl-D-alanine dipeptidase